LLEEILHGFVELVQREFVLSKKENSNFDDIGLRISELYN